MEALTNSRHEAFAQAVATGKSATAAYVSAGFKPHRQSASRLLTKVDVAARVATIREATGEKAVLTKARALEILRGIAENKAAKHSDRIAAVKVAGSWCAFETGTEAERLGAAVGAISFAEQMAAIRRQGR